MKDRLIALNQPILRLEDSHPAKRFLCAFAECLGNCGGCEAGLYDVPIDQEWTSATDGKAWKFSAFVYTCLAFDLQLDGFITSATRWTRSERWALENLPRFRSLIHECARAAEQAANTDCLELTEEVLHMLDLWDEYLAYRQEMIVSSPREADTPNEP
jgi:hypothetical protein